MCDAEPYNIKTLNRFNNYFNFNEGDVIDLTTKQRIDYEQWARCLKTDISTNVTNLNTISTQINSWKTDKKNDDTATELNNYSMTLYEADLKYTFSKIFFFIILAIVYIYFFKVNGIITPIINLFNFMKNKITVDIPLAAEKAIQKLPNVPEKAIKNMAKVPEIKTS
jgi:hypothetical protein